MTDCAIKIDMRLPCFMFSVQPGSAGFLLHADFLRYYIHMHM